MELKDFDLEPIITNSASIGQKYGTLVIEHIGRRIGTYRYIAICRCDCGTYPHLARIDGLKSGSVSSCGCGQLKAVTKHGLYKSILYRKWKAMHGRCYNHNNSRFADYGGRGIEVCLRWHDMNTFISDMESAYFDKAELDRKDNNGNYSPENCRWLTHAEQAANKRNNVLLTFEGRTQHLSKWAKDAGLPVHTLWNRITHYGWSAERAITTPSLSADERCQLARDKRKKSL